MIVVDASAVMSWLVADETEFGSRLTQVRNGESIAPAMCVYEVCNGLRNAVMRGRMSTVDATAALGVFYSLRIGIEMPTRESASSITTLCHTHGLTAYDAAYLELAMRRGAALATHDSALCAVAPKVGVRVV